MKWFCTFSVDKLFLSIIVFKILVLHLLITSIFIILSFFSLIEVEIGREELNFFNLFFSLREGLSLLEEETDDSEYIFDDELLSISSSDSVEIDDNFILFFWIDFKYSLYALILNEASFFKLSLIFLLLLLFFNNLKEKLFILNDKYKDYEI